MRRPVSYTHLDKSLRGIVDSKQTELLFVALFLRMLKMGGRCACIVPNGVLFRSNSKAYGQLRRELVDNQNLEAIIYMPSGVFKPYSGAVSYTHLDVYKRQMLFSVWLRKLASTSKL